MKRFSVPKYLRINGHPGLKQCGDGDYVTYETAAKLARAYRWNGAALCMTHRSFVALERGEAINLNKLIEKQHYVVDKASQFYKEAMEG